MPGSEPVIDLGKIRNLKLTEFNEDDDEITRKIVSLDDTMVSLNKQDFLEFKALVLTLLEIEPFAAACTGDFLIDHSLEWLLEVHKTKKASSSVTLYLLTAIEKKTTIHHYFFRIESLAIEKEVKLGAVSIMFFTDERIYKVLETLGIPYLKRKKSFRIMYLTLITKWPKLGNEKITTMKSAYLYSCKLPLF